MNELVKNLEEMFLYLVMGKVTGGTIVKYEYVSVF